MKHLYMVRRPAWERVDDNKVPLDFLDVMEYFNRMLGRGEYPLVPRNDPITYDEISKVWVPSKNRNITYLAVDRDSQKVVCSGTLKVDTADKEGELSITKDLDYKVDGVGRDVTRAVIGEALFKGITVSIHTSVENIAMIRVMEKLGHEHTRLISDYEKYRGKIRATSFDVYEWVIRPNSLP